MEEHDELLFSQEDFTPEAPAESPPSTPPADAKDDLPWLELAERFPDFAGKGNTQEFRKAVKSGERPLEAYMRLENQRLTGELELLRRELVLRDTATGSSLSTAGEEEADPFIQGLSYMR